MQNLVCSQGNKIASCKEEIEGYITKLQTLDQQVQILNTKITQIRQDSRDRMLQTLQQTSQRKPQMQKAHTRHERLVTSIENYRKGANYLIRLSNLDKRVKAARQRQDIWDALQSWIPTVGKLKNACSKKPKGRTLISFLISNSDFDGAHQSSGVSLPKLLKKRNLSQFLHAHTYYVYIPSLHSYALIRYPTKDVCERIHFNTYILIYSSHSLATSQTYHFCRFLS